MNLSPSVAQSDILINTMKTILFLFLSFLMVPLASGSPVRIFDGERILMTVSEEWKSVPPKPPMRNFPYQTAAFAPVDDGNALFLITLLNNDLKEVPDIAALRELLKVASVPYVKTPEELERARINRIPVQGGVALYSSFIDPDLVGKPVKKEDYKTATPVIISLRGQFLIQATILCDDLDGDHFKQAFEMLRNTRATN